jgi:hypothetical protein
MPAQAKQEWEVHKLGGASLNESAMGCMTDQLIKVIASALKDFRRGEAGVG